MTIRWDANTKRSLLAAAAGGAVLWLWGFAAWFLLPIHQWTVRNFPAQEMMRTMLLDSGAESGLYQLPGKPLVEAGAGYQQSDWEAWTKEGPHLVMFYRREGTTVFPFASAILGLLLNGAAAGLGLFLLSKTQGSIRTRAQKVLFLATLGVLVSVFAHLQQWNWMHAPFAHAAMMTLDTVVGWALAGWAMVKVLDYTPSAEAVTRVAGATAGPTRVGG